MTKIANEFLREDLVELKVANWYAFDKKSELEYFSGTLKSHELSAKAENIKVKSGRDNSVQYVIPKDKEFTLKITDVWSRQDIIAKKFGGDIKAVGSDTSIYKMHMPRNYTVKKETSKLYIELVNEPIEGETFIVYNNKTNKAIETSKVTVDSASKKKYTITDTDIAEGDTVFVTGFKTKALATERYSDITSDSKMPEIFVCVEVPVYDGQNNLQFLKQYIFPRCQMSSSVTSKGESESKEVNDDTEIDVLKDKALDYLGRIIYVSPEESISASV
ncbi:UNVERIFIED_ORG: hypothetical protein B2H93_13450 [Clostridium botulinum]